MGAVHIGIGHDDDLVVAGLFHVEVLAHAGAEGSDHGLEGVGGQDPVQTGFFHVEDLAPEGKDGLDLGVTAYLGRTAGGVPFDDEDFRQGRVLFPAVCQLTRQRRAVQGALAPGQLPGAFGRFPGPGGLEVLFHDALGHVGVFFQEGGELFVDDGLHDALDLGVAQLGLGLPFKLGLQELDADDGRQPFPDVLAGQVLVVALDVVVTLGVVVDGPGQGAFKPVEVAAPLGGEDVVGVGIDVFRIARGVLEGQLQAVVVHVLFVVGDLLVQGILVAVDVLDIGPDAPFVMVAVFLLLIGTGVLQGDGDALVQEGQLPQAVFQDVVVVDQLIEDIRVGLEMDLGPGAVGGAHDLQLRGLVALGEGLAVHLLILLDLHVQLFGQGVDDGDPHAVETPGDLVPAAAELTAGVEHGQGQLDPGLLLFVVHPRGDAPAVIGDGDAVVLFDDDVDVLAVTGQGFVDGVVHHFVNQVVEPLFACAADVHPRPALDGLQTFQNLDLVGAVLLPCFCSF